MNNWQVRRKVQNDFNRFIAGAPLTSYDPNNQAKLLLKARLPVKPVQSPCTPWLRTICRMASMGPLYCLSATDLCDCICSFTGPSAFKREMLQCYMSNVPLRCSMGVARSALCRPCEM